MQKTKMFFAALIAIGGLSAAPASAMPVSGVQMQDVAGAQLDQAGWRCGPGWHVNRWGRCVPMGRPMWHHRRWRRY